MGVTYSVIYHELVAGDISSISLLWKKKIRQSIETKLSTHPEIFGVPLRNTLKGYRKLRVGDYRVIFSIEINKVKIFAIGHRSHIYNLSNNRLN